MNTRFQLLLLLMLCKVPLYAAYKIQGVIRMDDSWDRQIYLSAINALEDLNTASDDFIINKSIIQADGTFQMSGNNLPNENRLYRLHVCKTGDPASTIIIGGKEENHIHFILNNQSSILFENLGTQSLFKDWSVQSDLPNQLLRELEMLVAYWKKQSAVPSVTSREFSHLQLEKNLHHFADTCQIALVGLLAIYWADMEENFAKWQSTYLKFREKWAPYQANSPYFQEFEQQLAFLSFQSNQTIDLKIAIGLAIFVLVFYLWISQRRKQKRREQTTSKLLDKKDALSRQERRVFQLLTAGKTNKEISAELNIGVSTVKSHVHKIYSKLQIKSRKEAMRFKE